MAIACQRGIQHLNHPVRQVGVQAVIHPLPLPPIRQQPAGTQLRQVAGNLRLTQLQRRRQLTHAQLTLGGNQQHQARAGLIGQALEDGGWGEVFEHVFGQADSISEYAYMD